MLFKVCGMKEIDKLSNYSLIQFVHAEMSNFSKTVCSNQQNQHSIINKIIYLATCISKNYLDLSVIAQSSQKRWVV